MNKGRLFLIPNMLSEESASLHIPSGIADRIKDIKLYFVESPKAARRLLIDIGLKDRLDDIDMISMKKGMDRRDLDEAAAYLKEGKDIGVLSDAGCPGVADPGNVVVSMAHRLGAPVIPFTGPSSILLGLMASGFNGQNFAFHGYLPKEPIKRKKAIRSIEKDIFQKSQTQIFIETPYRNMYLFKDLLSECQKNTKICLAIDLTSKDERIEVRSVEDWRKQKIDINKNQCIFLIYK